VEGWLPREIVHRPKRGFGVPIRHWFRGVLQQATRAVLADRRTRERGLLDERAVTALLDEHAAGRRDQSVRIWALLVLGLWPHAAFPLRTSLGHPNTMLQIGRLALHCRRERVSILHCHDFYSNVVGIPAARMARVRAVASRRDLAHWLSPTQVKLLAWSCRAA